MVKDPQKGVSLIIVFFISVIILAVTLSVSIILYSELNVLRNVNNSMASLYIAESGVEKVLYYDRQVLVTATQCTDTCSAPNETCIGGHCITLRGLCSMSANCLDGGINGTASDASAYCNGISNTAGSLDPTQGCAANICDDCTVSFKTSLGNAGKMAYTVTAQTHTADTNATNSLDVTSDGVFGGASRQIEIQSPK